MEAREREEVEEDRAKNYSEQRSEGHYIKWRLQYRKREIFGQ